MFFDIYVDNNNVIISFKPWKMTENILNYFIPSDWYGLTFYKYCALFVIISYLSFDLDSFFV